MLKYQLNIVLIVISLIALTDDGSAVGRLATGQCHASGGCASQICGHPGWGYGAPESYLNWAAAGIQPAARTHFADPLRGAGRSTSNSVFLTVTVPADAKVFVNDHLTKSEGLLRQFSTSGLRSTSAYEYRVRAEFVVDGKFVREEKNAIVTVGETAIMIFSATAVDPGR